LRAPLPGVVRRSAWALSGGTYSAPQSISFLGWGRPTATDCGIQLVFIDSGRSRRRSEKFPTTFSFSPPDAHDSFKSLNRASQSYLPLYLYHLQILNVYNPLRRQTSPARHIPPTSHHVHSQRIQTQFRADSSHGREALAWRMGGPQVWWDECGQVCGEYSGHRQVRRKL